MASVPTSYYSMRHYCLWSLKGNASFVNFVMRNEIDWWCCVLCLAAAEWNQCKSTAGAVWTSEHRDLCDNCHWTWHGCVRLKGCVTLVCLLSVYLWSCKKVKVKEGYTLKERRRGALLPFIGCWARRWINHYCLWSMASVMPDLRLPSQPKLVLTAPARGGTATLTWLEWLVTYWDSLPAQRWSPIQALTRPSVE